MTNRQERSLASPLALLQILALGNQEVAAGQLKPLKEVVSRLKQKRSAA